MANTTYDIWTNVEFYRMGDNDGKVWLMTMIETADPNMDGFQQYLKDHGIECGLSDTQGPNGHPTYDYWSKSADALRQMLRDWWKADVPDSAGIQKNAAGRWEMKIHIVRRNLADRWFCADLTHFDVRVTKIDALTYDKDQLDDLLAATLAADDEGRLIAICQNHDLQPITE